MKRITVKSVLDAYKATGLRPRRKTALDECECCAIGALCQEETGKRGNAYEWAEHLFGKKYAWGFICGFDWQPGDKAFRSVGFRDGRTAAKAVFAEAAQ